MKLGCYLHLELHSSLHQVSGTEDDAAEMRPVGLPHSCQAADEVVVWMDGRVQMNRDWSLGS